MERGELTEFEVRNKIAELTSYIASDWPGIEERKRLYVERSKLEALLEELKDARKKPEDKLQEAKKT